VAGLVTVDSITNPDAMFENASITNIIAEVTHVDTEKKIVELSDGASIDYDKIILGTGANQVIPEFEGVKKCTGCRKNKKIFGREKGQKPCFHRNRIY
jgi:NADH dehydrogenase FAD-containing subunit